jgi:transposase
MFAAAKHPSQVLCVALDYAKAEHRALICNGVGDVVCGAFGVENSVQGIAALLERVRQCARKRKIPPCQIFFGGEDSPSFAANFVHQLREEKFVVVRVNAWEAKQQRSNFQASSDSLDLLGIARCCLNRRGESVAPWPQDYINLRIVTRDRERVVRQCTALTNRMHTYVDQLFPGFLDVSKSGVTAWSQASLDLMSQGLSAQQISRRPQKTLAQWLGRRGVEQAGEVASKLKGLAREALGPAPEQTVLLEQSLGHWVGLYRETQKVLAALGREQAHWLLRTPGALLTSIGGIGVRLAAGLTAELGPPKQWRTVDRICSYAGVVSRTKQTGGSGKEPVVGSVGRRCNTHLKNVVLQAVEKVRQWGAEDWQQKAQALEGRGAHTEFALAKSLIACARCLVRTGTVYLPKALLDPKGPAADRATYYQDLWEKLPLKWKGKADLKDVFAPQHPLGQWRDMVRELYAQALELPGTRAAAKTRASTP